MLHYFLHLRFLAFGVNCECGWLGGSFVEWFNERRFIGFECTFRFRCEPCGVNNSQHPQPAGVTDERFRSHSRRLNCFEFGIEELKPLRWGRVAGRRIVLQNTIEHKFLPYVLFSGGWGDGIGLQNDSMRYCFWFYFIAHILK